MSPARLTTPNATTVRHGVHAGGVRRRVPGGVMPSSLGSDLAAQANSFLRRPVSFLPCLRIFLPAFLRTFAVRPERSGGSGASLRPLRLDSLTGCATALGSISRTDVA